MRDTNEITGEIVTAAFLVHTKIGPGLLESIYEAVLARTLERRGLYVERQKPIAFQYEDMRFDEAFRADLLIENKVLVELKATETLARVHGKQVLTYLRLLNLPVGLLINFGAPSLRDGLRRIMNSRAPFVQPLPGTSDLRGRTVSQSSHTGSTESAEEQRGSNSGDSVDPV